MEGGFPTWFATQAAVAGDGGGGTPRSRLWGMSKQQRRRLIKKNKKAKAGGRGAAADVAQNKKARTGGRCAAAHVAAPPPAPPTALEVLQHENAELHQALFHQIRMTPTEDQAMSMVLMKLTKWKRERLISAAEAVLHNDKGKALDLLFADLIVWLQKDREVRPASNPLTASPTGGYVLVRMKGVGAGGADAWALLLAGEHEMVRGIGVRGGGIGQWCLDHPDRLKSIGGLPALKRIQKLEGPQSHTFKDLDHNKQQVTVADTAYRAGLCVQAVVPRLVFPCCLGVDDVRHAFREALAQIERVEEMKQAASAAGKARRKKRARDQARERERENFRHHH